MALTKVPVESLPPIDGIVIGGTTPAAISGTTGSFSDYTTHGGGVGVTGGESNFSVLGNLAGSRVNIGADANYGFARSYDSALGMLVGTANATPLELITDGLIRVTIAPTTGAATFSGSMAIGGSTIGGVATRTVTIQDATNSALQFLHGATATGVLYSDADEFNIYAYNSSLKLGGGSGGTPAVGLTLASTAAATFAGQVTASRIDSLTANGFLTWNSVDTSYWRMKYDTAGLTFDLDGAVKATIDNAGNLGLGVSASVGYRARIRGEGADNTTRALLVDNSAGSALLEVLNDGAINFGATTPRMILSASGNLLVGKPSAAFSTVGVVAYATGQIDITSLSSQALALNRTGTDGSILDIYNDGVSAGSITVSGATSSFVGTSDPRVKTPFSPITGALAIISQTVENGWVGNYEYLSRPDIIHYGYNAHALIDNQPQLGGVEGEGPRNLDVGDVYEEAVLDEDGNELSPAKTVQPAAVDKAGRVPLLEAAIYDLLKMNEALTARIEALEGAN